jgi:hypothetical protein
MGRLRDAFRTLDWAEIKEESIKHIDFFNILNII